MPGEALYLKVTRSMYLAARKATLMEQQKQLDPSIEDPFLHLLEANLQNSPAPSSDSHSKEAIELTNGKASPLVCSSPGLDELSSDAEHADSGTLVVATSNCDQNSSSEHLNLLEDRESKV